MWSLWWQQGELEHAIGVVDALHEEIAARGVHLYIVIMEPGLHVNGDASVLLQIIADLYRSQIRAAARGERVELRAFREANYASLTVIGQRANPGELLPQQVRRLEKALGETGGTFSARLIDTHVSYVATLPLRPVLDDAGSADAIRDNALGGMTVMVLDDQEEARDALEAVLESVGAKVVQCASGDDVLSYLRERPADEWPDALLCDIVLADERDGYEVMRLIRDEEASRRVSLGERLPAIALTGHAQAETRVRAQAAGFQAHLTKPVPAPKLIAAIESVTTRSP